MTFYAEVPGSGAYRLYLDFQHEGKVRTAEFTVNAGTGTTPAPVPAEEPHDEGAPAGGHSH